MKFSKLEKRIGKILKSKPMKLDDMYTYSIDPAWSDEFDVPKYFLKRENWLKRLWRRYWFKLLVAELIVLCVLVAVFIISLSSVR